MRLINQKAEYLPQANGLKGIYKQIELAARTCYKSEDKITEDSASSFVDRLIKSGHPAMLEHGTVYFKTNSIDNDENYWILVHSPYAKVVYRNDWNYVTTNLRAVIELFPTIWHGFLNTYICEPTEHHEKRYSFKLTTSIGVTRELNRHRVNSIAEQSTRYCNYSKDKFGNEITFCKPSWIDDEELAKIEPYKRVVRKQDASSTEHWITALLNSEDAYLELINQGWQPQQAREVLPLCTASEIVHTAFASDWKHFFDLRLFSKTGKPHPNMLQLAELMKAEAEKHGIWDDIMK